MGSGINAARIEAPEHAEAIDNMKDQLLIVLINRLGGEVTIPVSELDGTGQFIGMMKVNDDGVITPSFTFVVTKKS